MSEPLRLPPVIGHRGAARHAPENTIAGFRAAARLGAPWVEFDVRLTADSCLATYHDEDLERTTRRRGRIGDMALADVAGLDAGSWFDAAFAGEPVPTLDHSLAAIAGLGMGANIELKPAPEREDELAAATVAALGRSWPAGRPLVVSSFDRDLLRAMRRAAPQAALGLLVGRVQRGWRRAALELGCASVHFYHRHVTPKLAGAVKEAGLELAAWVVDEAPRAGELWDRGVDSLISGTPDVLVQAWHRRRA